MHKIIDSLAILDIHKNLIPNCGMWVDLPIPLDSSIGGSMS